MDKIELLAPAGDMEKMKMAFLYGADAVYMGGKAFGLRASSKNFEIDEIYEAVKYAHKLNKKIYITLNIYAHNSAIEKMKDYIHELYKANVDAVIVSDIGVFSLIRELEPNLPIHVSTQANLTNYKACEFFYNQGAERVILARELSIAEIKEIKEKTPKELTVEAFVHGAMCISYSGRCLLSNYMTHRGANQGACAQACRWGYNLVEEKRPNEYYPVYEDEKGTYIFNSKDLCMIEHLHLLKEAGVMSFKIEGRMKSPFYVATVIRAYRHAIDALYEKGDNYFESVYLEELKKVSHRAYTTGFFFNKADENTQLYENNIYIREYDFIGIVLKQENDRILVEQRNKFQVGDEVELYGPQKELYVFTINELFNEKGEKIISAPHAQQKVYIDVPFKVSPYSLLRKRRG